MGALPSLSVEEYLKLDRAAEVKSEFHDGEMFPMDGVSWEHSRIFLRFGAALMKELHGSPCEVVAAPLRVRVSPTKFLLPDLLVVCGKPELTDEFHDTITNPKVVIEILSPSTTDYDYGQKFILYRQLASFEEYILVSQDQARIEIYRQTSDNRWILSTYEGLQHVLPIDSLGVSIPLSAVYEGIDFPSPAA